MPAEPNSPYRPTRGVPVAKEEPGARARRQLRKVLLVLALLDASVVIIVIGVAEARTSLRLSSLALLVLILSGLAAILILRAGLAVRLRRRSGNLR